MSVRVIFFPAKCGDCFIIEFTIPNGNFRMLVDGGTPATSNIVLSYLKKDGTYLPIDLVVVTHIDNDHIGGILELMRDKDFNASVKEIWFNATTQFSALLPQAVKSLSVLQGIELETMLHNDPRWNKRFAGAAVAINPDGSPRSVEIGENVTLDILSPGVAQLNELKRNWETIAGVPDPSSDKIEGMPARVRSLDAGKDVNTLGNSDFVQDTAFANGSSIAFLLNVDKKSLLFMGDAFPNVVSDAADLLPRETINLRLFKVSHHGSAGNTDERIVRKFPADYYLFSTNGAHRHPDDESIARILVHAPGEKALVFNYDNTLSSWRGVDFEAEWRTKVQSHDGKTAIELNL